MDIECIVAFDDEAGPSQNPSSLCEPEYEVVDPTFVMPQQCFDGSMMCNPSALRKEREDEDDGHFSVTQPDSRNYTQPDFYVYIEEESSHISQINVQRIIAPLIAIEEKPSHMQRRYATRRRK